MKHFLKKLKQFWLKYFGHRVQKNRFEIFLLIQVCASKQFILLLLHIYAYNKVFVNGLSQNSFSNVQSFQWLELGEDTAADVTEFFTAADCSEK